MRAKEPCCALVRIGGGLPWSCMCLSIYRKKELQRTCSSWLSVRHHLFLGLSAVLAASSFSWHIVRGSVSLSLAANRGVLARDERG